MVSLKDALDRLIKHYNELDNDLEWPEELWGIMDSVHCLAMFHLDEIENL